MALVSRRNQEELHSNKAENAKYEKKTEKSWWESVFEFVKDNKLSDGQCKIETPYGVVDCGVDTQLSALLKDIRSLV